MGKTTNTMKARITVPITVKITSGILGFFAVVLVYRGIIAPFIMNDSERNADRIVNSLIQVALGVGIMFCAVRFYQGHARIWVMLISLCAAFVGASNLSIYFSLPPEVQAAAVTFLVINCVEILLAGTAFALLFTRATREYTLKVTEEEERELSRYAGR